MTQQLTFSIDDSIFLSLKREKEEFLKDMIFYEDLLAVKRMLPEKTIQPSAQQPQQSHSFCFC